MAKISLGKFTNIKFLLMVVGALFVISFVYGMYTVKEAFTSYSYYETAPSVSGESGGSTCQTFPTYSGCDNYDACVSKVKNKLMGSYSIFSSGDCTGTAGSKNLASLTAALCPTGCSANTTTNAGTSVGTFTPSGLYTKNSDGSYVSVGGSYDSNCPGADNCTTTLWTKYGKNNNLFTDSTGTTPATLSILGGNSYCKYNSLCKNNKTFVNQLTR